MKSEPHDAHREFRNGVPAQGRPQLARPIRRVHRAHRHPTHEDHEDDHLRVRTVTDKKAEVSRPDGLVDQSRGPTEYEDRVEKWNHGSGRLSKLFGRNALSSCFA